MLGKLMKYEFKATSRMLLPINGAMLLFALIPFTRLVHLFSGFAVPFKYIGRSAIVYRRRKQAPAGRELEFPEQTGFAGK